MTRSTTTADEIYFGRARNPYYQEGKYGVESPALQFDDLGAIAASNASGIGTGITATAAAAITMNGALATTGVGVFDIGRAPSITSVSTDDLSAVTFTFTGTDDLGRTIKHNVVGPTGGVRNGTVGFKTITSIVPSAGWATASPIKFGSANVFNFKFRVADKGKVSSVSQDGKPETTLTIVAGQTATVVATATTSDPRGTWAPNTAPDAAKAWNVVYKMNRSDDTLAFGITPFSG